MSVGEVFSITILSERQLLKTVAYYCINVSKCCVYCVKIIHLEATNFVRAIFIPRKPFRWLTKIWQKFFTMPVHQHHKVLNEAYGHHEETSRSLEAIMETPTWILKYQ